VAVERPSQIKDFWPIFKRGALLRIFLSQLLITIVLGAILIFTNVFSIKSTVFWIIITSLFILGILRGLFIVKYAARPAKDLLDTLIHVSGELTDTKMPNPNDNRYAKNGFREALETIHEISSNAKLPTADETPESIIQNINHDPVEAALDATNCGFVVMNSERKITYASKPSPINIDRDNHTSLSLLFNNNDTLDAWLDECAQHSVHNEHVWSRIPDRLPEAENRRFFDVIATYDKGSANEVVLVLVDRTAIYNVSEEDLDFIAFAAHELRGPITVIRGYLDVLEDELGSVLAEDQHELFRRLTVSANRLSGYINNILNTSRYDRRHLKVHLSEDSLSAIYDTITDDMQLRASAQNRLLSVSFPPDLPTIAADRASISEVLGNLIDNAIKYSNEGGAINVTAAVRGGFVEVAVQDHGIGMPSSVVSNLFQKFYRSHRSRETVAGTGIGLYISKAIVESHGGSISVSSEEGKGSTFTVALPIYSTVAAKLAAGDNSNEGLIEHGDGWIKNHSMYRG
jgi:signal transduction histidine kinase